MTPLPPPDEAPGNPQVPAATLPLTSPFNKSINTKCSKRNYRTKKKTVTDSDSDDDNPDLGTHSVTNSSNSSSSSSKLPYVESQNAQTLGEVYPGLARLSFLDQSKQDMIIIDPMEQQDTGTLQKVRRTRQPEEVPQPFLGTASASASAPAPHLQTPSVTSSSTGSTASLVEIRDTGSASKGRGLFSVAKETLKPGTLVFKELGYGQVVHDSSLPYVCSACFKDTREEQGEDGQGIFSSSSPSASTSGSSSGSGNGSQQRKLVRCAGCKVVWYCNKTCQVKDWKLHHHLECPGIQKSMANVATKDVWTKHTMDTTAVRAICRLVRRRERVARSAKYMAEHHKMDMAQKNANEVYFSGLNQKEEEWLDQHGAEWVEKYLNTYEHDHTVSSSSSALAKGALEESSQLTKIMAVVMSCVVSPTENRQSFLKGSSSSTSSSSSASASSTSSSDEISSGSSGLDLIRKLNAYGFSMTNLETTTVVGLGLYIQSMAFMNHSCVPNCVYIFKGPRVECRVIRDIQPGEEMTISYIDQIGTTKERQRQLKEQYNFNCECPLCQYFPANPLKQAQEEPLRDIIDATHLPKAVMDPKQGFVCSNTTCTSPVILVTEAQLLIYNKVQRQCSACHHTTELDQELVQANQQEADQLLAGFVREMNKHSSGSPKRKNPRNFELPKAVVPILGETSSSPGSREALLSTMGGLNSVKEPSSQALQYFGDAYRALTGNSPQLDIMGSKELKKEGSARITKKNQPDADADEVTDEIVAVRRNILHHAVRLLEQTGFDEAVSQKNWQFALQRSIELEVILRAIYLDHHPLKSIQSYYTCKIANLLANLLLEESTIEIEDEEDSEGEKREDGAVNSDDERDLGALRAAMKVGQGSMQEQLVQRQKNQGLNDDGDDKNNNKKKKKKGEDEEDVDDEEDGSEKTRKRTRVQEAVSRELLQYLKGLVPKIEDAEILQGIRICWGKDGKLVSGYRHQVDSLKQALHYAELPFVKDQ
ncbi:SET and MYND domain-containing protein 3 [Podila humilis]|nr:SET and MYND domain-containing protein 3 [Podila humilis]